MPKFAKGYPKVKFKEYGDTRDNPKWREAVKAAEERIALNDFQKGMAYARSLDSAAISQVLRKWKRRMTEVESYVDVDKYTNDLRKACGFRSKAKKGKRRKP